MDYDAAAASFQTQGVAELNAIRDSLIAAGLSANRVSVDTADTEGQDMRCHLRATRGANSILLDIELTPVRPPGITMEVFISLYLFVNGTLVATTFVPDPPQLYTSLAGMDTMLSKYTGIVMMRPELITRLRAGLGL